MATGNIIVRVQSPIHGTKRIETKTTLKIEEFLKKVQTEFNLPVNGWKVWTNREKTSELVALKTKTLSSYQVKHGDMLYLDIHPNTSVQTAANSIESVGLRSSGLSSSSLSSLPSTGDMTSMISRPSSSSLVRDGILEDEVDQFLWKQDGRIERERNEQLCRHGPLGKCLHCVPYEPYDEEYLAKVNPPIKFLSFHSNLRKLTGGVDKGKFAMLENLSCKIKPGCREHPPWPGGICTKCQPNAVTLQRQKYRHVDYIQFENKLLMERFLDYWRKTGSQRIGLLYGRYEHHKDVPLGIKAVVTAIYEPQQKCTRNSVELLEYDWDVVNKVAAGLGLRPVGWIFTDLVPLDTSTGTVKHFRGNINSHFLSAEECIMAADLQSRHPNACRLSPDGHFGSKFVTVVVTGDADNHIHFEGYQVSNQCMALVSDDCLIPTRDAPELGYVKESTNEQYVPDVFYKVKDSYGNEVTQLARPLPVEYLLVDMPAAFPRDQAFTFFADPIIRPFTIENRSDVGEAQDFNAFSEYIHQFTADRYSDALSDFHLLVFLATCDMLPLKDDLYGLLECLKLKDVGAFHRWTKSEAWATVEQLLEANVPSPRTDHHSSSFSTTAQRASPMAAFSDLPTMQGLAPFGSGAMWSCKHCTFHNEPHCQTCEMCGLPRQ